MDSELEWKEQDLHSAVLIALFYLELLLLDMEGLWRARVRASRSTSCDNSLLAFLSLSSSLFLVFALILGTFTSLDNTIAFILH